MQTHDVPVHILDQKPEDSSETYVRFFKPQFYN